VIEEPRKVGAQPGHNRIDWTDVEHLFGKVFDSAIARQVGCSKRSVRSERNRRGIPACKPISPGVEVQWENVSGLGVLRDEVIAQRIGVEEEDVRAARKRLNITRRTGPTGWKRRIDIIARDPAAASTDDVVFLVERVAEARRKTETVRKATEPAKLRAELRAARCALWVLYSDEEAEDLTGAPAAFYRETIDTFTEAVESWWTRKAIEMGEDIAFAERNAEHDPAPAEFIDWVMETGKTDEHAAKARRRKKR